MQKTAYEMRSSDWSSDVCSSDLPPYVRHHLIDADAKRWFADTAAGFGVKASKLAGLHIHFYVRTLELARTGDYGVFITSSEWLDVNYGATLRNLLTQRLGGVALHVLDPAIMPLDLKSKCLNSSH